MAQVFGNLWRKSYDDMGRKREYTKILVGDFETTVFKNQEYTEVWASAITELFDETDNVEIFHNIEDTLNYLISLNENTIIYYHNLKFDGEFWLSYFLKLFEQAKDETEVFNEDSEMANNTFKYMINDMGQFYSITLKVNNRYINFRDSYKLLPFSLRRIGESFKTKHQKLDMEYEGFRYAGCEITEEEQEYIKNDVLVIKEALEICIRQGHDKLTIGSCCLEEYKKSIGAFLVKDYFPNVKEMSIDKEIYGSDNVDEYIRHSYKGGWCYLADKKDNIIFHNGITLDVNSLYPSMMSSESGNYYPIGKPTFWSGNEIPLRAQCSYYFVRIKTRFKLKEGYLPCIQIKNNICYRGTEYQKTSDFWDRKLQRWVREYYDTDGNYHDGRLILTLTMTDYQLIKEHYELYDCEILDGCYFEKKKGIFDTYIEKYKKQKMESKGAMRELAKLFLNNLYGKMASSDNSSYKIASIDEEGVVKYQIIDDFQKKTLYIPVGSAITSYARNFTIRAAQVNYYGNGRGFIYADTDSLHMDLAEDEIKNIKIDDKNFCCWKLENKWDTGLFIRQKTYIEIENDNINVKCAGMPEVGKKMFIASFTGKMPNDIKKYNDKQIKWMEQKRELKDFTFGLTIPDAKLIPKRIRGGVVLVNTTYELLKG